MNIVKTALLPTTALACVALAGQANASLALFNSFTGNELVSTDGCGSNTATCTLQSNIQAGSTIQAAYLYSSTFSSTTDPNGVTLSKGAANVSPTFTALGVNNGFLQAWRADVTSFVQANANIGSLTTWTANEGAKTTSIDGETLVIVYSNATILRSDTPQTNPLRFTNCCIPSRRRTTPLRFARMSRSVGPTRPSTC